MATAIVHPLHLAEVTLSGAYNPPDFTDTRIPVFGFLILAGAEVILVDTGVGEGNDYIDRQFQPARTDLGAALARHDVAIADVTLLINSHLHFDHCGGNGLFPRVPVYVQAAELAAARQPNYTVRAWFDDANADLRAVEGDHEVAPGVHLVASPGHTPGHQSVLVETGQDSVLVAAQAAFSRAEYDRGGDPDVQAHDGLQAAYLDSMRRLQALGADHVLFSHDA